MSLSGGMGKRLREARLSAGFRSASAAIDKFGWKGSTYRAHENGQNPFKIDDAEAYGEAFSVSPIWLLTGFRDESRPAAPPSVAKRDPVVALARERREGDQPAGGSLDVDMSIIYIKGVVAQNVWREAAVSRGENFFKASPFPLDPTFPAHGQFDLAIDDGSLDGFARDGDFLRCIDGKFIDNFPLDGDLVVVERRKEDLVETTVRRVRRLGNRVELWPEQKTDDVHSKVFVVDYEKPDPFIKVIAKVLWAFRKAT